MLLWHLACCVLHGVAVHVLYLMQLIQGALACFMRGCCHIAGGVLRCERGVRAHQSLRHCQGIDVRSLKSAMIIVCGNDCWIAEMIAA